MRDKLNDAYSYQSIDISHLGLKILSKFLSGTFKSSKFSKDYLDWLYNKNPAGNVIGFNAFFKNKLVGHYALIPIKAKYKDQQIKALMSLNTATDKNHQGKGLFTILANMTYRKCYDLGFDLMFGVANANSIHGFISKLDWKYIDQLDTRISLALPKIINNKKLENCLIFPLSDNETEWRLSNPNFVYSKSTYGAVNIIANEINFFSRSIVKVTEATFPNKTCLRPKINFWIGISNSYSWERGLVQGIKIPEFLKPSPLHLIYKNLSSELSLDRTNIQFEAINFDAF